jgi:sec-independent protein translocase protein TatA
MGELSPWHWIIVLLIFALLFGSKRLPDAARGLGRSLRIFKAEMSSARDDEAAPAGAAGPAAPFTPAPFTPAPTDAVPTGFVPTDAVAPPPLVIPPVVGAPVVAPMAMTDQVHPVPDH